MAIVKRAAWIVIGVLIGALTTVSTAAVRRAQNQPTPRVVESPASEIRSPGRYWKFVKDTKTGACWLLAAQGNPEVIALAPAPADACPSE